jgi:uncharacterized membrane protein YcaP (DUF421 family)
MFPGGTFFSDASGLARVAVVGVLAYLSLVLLLRITGKRTLSKLNAFDLVVTVALGSTLATVLLSKSVALADGVLAFALLILLQYAVIWSSVQSKRVRGWIKAEPRLLFRDGSFLGAAMRRERVTREEVTATMRQSDWHDPASVRSVVLETDGSMSVIGSDA